MSENVFELLEQAVRSGGAESALDAVVSRFREQKGFSQLFEALLMKKRWELGLPLVQTEPLGDLPDAKRRAYEDAYIDAAREVGGLYLAERDIPRAWPYFRAIGETAPVAAAIEKVEPGDGIEQIIEIAFHERANPRKGFELLLANYGTCSAITTFEQFPGREGREESIRLLVRKLHKDLTESLAHAIAAREGTRPESQSIRQLVQGRDWLFEENNYHIDTSHLAAVIRFSIDLADPEHLELAVDLATYGMQLSPLFQYKGQVPFENIYEDYGVYLEALAGMKPEQAIAHFHKKIADAQGDEARSACAQALVALLARLKRFDEAIELSERCLKNVDAGYLMCPSIIQLCELAGDTQRMQQLAMEREDLLSFTAALVRNHR